MDTGTPEQLGQQYLCDHRCQCQRAFHSNGPCRLRQRTRRSGGAAQDRAADRCADLQHRHRPSADATADLGGFESQLDTNHYGHFVLYGKLFERIEASKGRIVVVASLGYKMGLRTIQFDDMNWDKNDSANPAYSQSKLAQMMFAYELQDRIKAAHKSAQVYVCHPGSSYTSLISTSGGMLTKVIWWLMTKSPLVQTAEKGAFPEVMCATEDGLEQRALYGPTGRMGFVDPVGKAALEPYAYEKDVMVKLWDRSEQETGFTWNLDA